MHQSQRACEGWLAVFTCVPNGRTVMDFSIDYASSHLARNCMRVEASWIFWPEHSITFHLLWSIYSKLNMERGALSSRRYHRDDHDEKLSTLMTYHFTLLFFIFSLIQVQFALYRHFTFSTLRCLDLLKMASCALACAQIHYVKIRTSLSMLQTTWYLWLSYW